ncbi:MAG: radical SAM/SPASM domain-containing protein [Candidatus Helarchaeota archaeon]
MKLTSAPKLIGPWRITFDTNPDQCNLNCIMCEENSIFRKITKKKQIRIMDFKIIERVITNTAQFGLKEIIPSTMGEPLLYKYFEQMIELIEKYGLKINLTTNGTFPVFDIEEWGKRILQVASDIKVSINGATKALAEKIMTGIDFEKQLTNISILVKQRDEIRSEGVNYPTISFQVTFLEKNLQELPLLLKLAIQMNIDRLKGHHLWVTWPELQSESLRRNSNSISRWNQMVDKLYYIADKFRLKNGKKIKLDNFYKISKNYLVKGIPREWKCPFLGKEAWIAWDGTFNVCCAPDNLRKSLGTFGNVNKHNFMDLWESKKYHKLVKTWGSHDVCKNCNMRRPLNDYLKC